MHQMYWNVLKLEHRLRVLCQNNGNFILGQIVGPLHVQIKQKQKCRLTCTVIVIQRYFEDSQLLMI